MTNLFRLLECINNVFFLGNKNRGINLVEVVTANLDYFRYGNVRVLIAESVRAPREAIRQALFELGIRKFTMAEDLHGAREALATGGFDLCIVSPYLANERVAPTVTEVRQSDLGDDPFVPVIMHTFEPTIDVMQEIVSAGVDVVVTLPISKKKLTTALNTLTDKRKPFVVTATYVGPDRRHNARPGAQEGIQIKVPNALRRRVKGDEGGDSPTKILQMVRDSQVECYANRIVLNIGKIAGLVACQNAGTLESWLVYLHETTVNLNKRISNTRHHDHQVLCEPLIEIVGQCLEGGIPSGRDLEVMQQLALAIEVGFKRDSTSSVEAALDISTMIRRVRIA